MQRPMVARRRCIGWVEGVCMHEWEAATQVRVDTDPEAWPEEARRLGLLDAQQAAAYVAKVLYSCLSMK